MSREDIQAKLVDLWDDLNFPEGDGGMEADKLMGRAYGLNVSEDGQVIQFKILRHGAIVAGGSSYAETQSWTVDLGKNAATYDSRRKQIRPPRSSWTRAEVERKAAEVAAVIRNGGKRPPNVEIIPNYDRLPAATKNGSAKRFKAALDAALKRV